MSNTNVRPVYQESTDAPKQRVFFVVYEAHVSSTTITNTVIDIDTITPHKRNYRSHPDEQLAQLGSSYARFGQFRSVVVHAQPDGSYVQVAGHGIVEAMKRNGAKEVRVDVLPVETPPEEVEAILIADNNLSSGASDDTELLAALLQSQQDAGFDLASMGSDEETLRQMLQELGDGYIAGDGEQEDGDEPVEIEEEQTRVNLGDVWQLGRHKIACMDALDPITYVKLLADVKPDVIITDPPYGMKLDTDYSKRETTPAFAASKGVKSGRKYAEVMGDNKDFDASPLVDMFSYVKEQFWFGADYYSSSLRNTMHDGCWLVWDKRLEDSFDKMLGSSFELIWSKQKHKRDILRHRWVFIFGTEHEPQRGRVHPTQKPILLIEDIIKRYSHDGDIILDPFLGSGSLVISAERTNRIAYGCELSTAYINHVITNWEKETGQTAVLLERVDEVTHA